MDDTSTDGKYDGLLHSDLTEIILRCAFEVINELGSGFLESVYERAMFVALRQSGLSVASQQAVDVYFRGVCVGHFEVDLLVEGKVLIEMKAAKALLPVHQAQVINYLNATGIEVGMLMNFGNHRLEFKRLTRNRSNQISDLN